MLIYYKNQSVVVKYSFRKNVESFFFERFDFIFKLFDYSRGSNSKYNYCYCSSDSSINCSWLYFSVRYELLLKILICVCISYIVWTRKGYQLFEEPRGSSVIKVKGVGKVKIGNPKIYHSG